MINEELANVDWASPSQQNIIDLYITRMDLLTRAIIYCRENGSEASVYTVDDVRSVICCDTKMTIKRYDSIVKKAIRILHRDGIPELFITEIAQESEYDYDEIYDELEELYVEYLNERQELFDAFNEVIDNANGVK